MTKKRSDAVYRRTRLSLLRFIRKSNNCELVRQTKCSIDEKFWLEFFMYVYSHEPDSNDDPRWDELFHTRGALEAFRRITTVLARRYGSPELALLLRAA